MFDLNKENLEFLLLMISKRKDLIRTESYSKEKYADEYFNLNDIEWKLQVQFERIKE